MDDFMLHSGNSAPKSASKSFRLTKCTGVDEFPGIP